MGTEGRDTAVLQHFLTRGVIAGQQIDRQLPFSQHRQTVFGQIERQAHRYHPMLSPSGIAQKISRRLKGGVVYNLPHMKAFSSDRSKRRTG